MSSPYPGQKTAVNIVLGAMTFGAPGTLGARLSDIKDIEAIIDEFLSHGHREIDAARVYGNGTNEQYLGQIDWKNKGVLMETKLYPVSPETDFAGNHSPASIRKFCQMSLDALKTDTIEMWYLHGPDRKTPFEDTLRAVNELYKEGKFKRLGISNYMSWEVAELCGICERNGWIKPTVYQGLYNAILRTVEPELFPCLRKFGIAFYGFNPVGGGFFTGRYSSITDEADSTSRFSGEGRVSTLYRKRYWQQAYFDGLNKISAAADKHGLTMIEVALRWTMHHSLMKREFGDAVLIGASSMAHIKQNLADFEKGALPEDVVEALDEAWAGVKGIANPYYH
ncbi:unnamed protein product [Mycena citricolor]|uniref:NADP-dependent oxidoreductase domain-containing protein n=1 Tax=Mycena citricolor TaxID=2018698 RepID=A0AAD2HFV1_9AGAR|nr:unnamed protein product [Mycena citricolor]CAK5276203.1 unnamed protein product [Mycena citricolor]